MASEWRKFFGRLYAAARWRVHRWECSEQHSFKATASGEQGLPQREEVVRVILRATPYWATGHLWLAQYALATNRLDLAFSSAQAVLALGASAALCFDARLVIARCQLKAHDYAAAERTLHQLKEMNPNSWAVREDCAALLVHRGQWQAAASELEAIPAQHLSGEGRAALEFVRGKLSPS